MEPGRSYLNRRPKPCSGKGSRLAGPISSSAPAPPSSAAPRWKFRSKVKSQRAITLTGVHFKVKHLGKRPPGVAFGGQCGGGALGRFLIADIDPPHPKLVQSWSTFRDRHKIIRLRPIRFPWTVSVTDPLLLYVGTVTRRCFCEWRADIPWVSGSRRGVIAIGRPGHGYRVVGDRGLPGYFGTENGWEGGT